MSNYFVLERNETPKGDAESIRRTVYGEANTILRILNDEGIKKTFIHSTDYKRFSGIENAPLEASTVTSLQTRLGQVGYRLTGPFSNTSDAHDYWESGKQSEPRNFPIARPSLASIL